MFRVENNVIYWRKTELLKLVWIPAIFVGFRFTVAPLLLFDALDQNTGIWFVVGYGLAVLSDIFDGIIARRLGVSTTALRQADSWADISLYLCIAGSAWLVYPQVLLAFKVPLLSAIAIQVCLFVVSLIKFKKMPSFHTYTAKAWGLALLIATIALFGFGSSKMLWLAIACCWLNSLEEIAMTLILPTWHCDILSVFHALALRKNPI